jgi:hypothetical protein
LVEHFLENVNVHRKCRLEDEWRQEDVQHQVWVEVRDGRVRLGALKAVRQYVYPCQLRERPQRIREAWWRMRRRAKRGRSRGPWLGWRWGSSRCGASRLERTMWTRKCGWVLAAAAHRWCVCELG